MKMLPAALERLSVALENATVLDPAADQYQKLAALIPSGAVKDTLSGTYLGHPAHPILVTVPIGTFTSAVALDLTGGDPDTVRKLIGFGLLSGFPTALTGLSDWGDTSGAERRVGLVHAASNNLGLLLFAASWVARRRGGSGRALALAGYSMFGVGGWLGGHLSYALGVGVDTTAFSVPPKSWKDACAESDLVDGVPLAASVGDLPVLVIRRGAQITAMGNRCTHRGAPLHKGEVVDGCIVCPWHGSRFDLTDGSVDQGPATRPQPMLETRVLDGRVQVRRMESRALRANTVPST
jgi:nitrite reductase/ring-hydroxylating ferredoxin subunit/uncharacterized membrane protein